MPSISIFSLSASTPWLKGQCFTGAAQGLHGPRDRCGKPVKYGCLRRTCALLGRHKRIRTQQQQPRDYRPYYCCALHPEAVAAFSQQWPQATSPPRTVPPARTHLTTHLTTAEHSRHQDHNVCVHTIRAGSSWRPARPTLTCCGTASGRRSSPWRSSSWRTAGWTTLARRRRAQSAWRRRALRRCCPLATAATMHATAAAGGQSTTAHGGADRCGVRAIALEWARHPYGVIHGLLLRVDELLGVDCTAACACVRAKPMRPDRRWQTIAEHFLKHIGTPRPPRTQNFLANNKPGRRQPKRSGSSAAADASGSSGAGGAAGPNSAVGIGRHASSSQQAACSPAQPAHHLRTHDPFSATSGAWLQRRVALVCRPLHPPPPCTRRPLHPPPPAPAAPCTRRPCTRRATTTTACPADAGCSCSALGWAAAGEVERRRGMRAGARAGLRAGRVRGGSS